MPQYSPTAILYPNLDGGDDAHPSANDALDDRSTATHSNNMFSGADGGGWQARAASNRGAQSFGGDAFRGGGGGFRGGRR